MVPVSGWAQLRGISFPVLIQQRGGEVTAGIPVPNPGRFSHAVTTILFPQAERIVQHRRMGWKPEPAPGSTTKSCVTMAMPLQHTVFSSSWVEEVTALRRIRQGWGIWTFNRLVHKTFQVCIFQPKQEVVWNTLCAAVHSSPQRGTQGYNPHPQPLRFWAEMTVITIMGNLEEIGQFWK